jgi:hypothetical protein
MPLNEIHARLANTILYYVIILAIWGLWRFVRREGVNSSYFGAIAIGEALIILQGVLGVILYLGGSGAALPRPAVHILYGIVSLLVLPGIYLFSRGDDKRRTMLIYAAAFLFLVGITLRGITTGGE